MNVNIVKKLENKRKNSQKETEVVIQEVKLLMDSEAEAERSALKVAGLVNHMEHIDQKRGQEIERAKFEEEYGNNVFTENEIKDICLKYDLRMLETRRFLGKIDGEVAVKLKHFMADKQGEMGNYSRNFYVIAPETAFQLEKQPRKPPRQIDPILVYKVPGADQYVFIHKWGRDFTLWRRFRGFYFESVFNMLLINWAILSIVFSMSVALAHGELNTLRELTWLILPVAAAIPLARLAVLIMFNDEKNWKSRTTKNTWRSEYKRRY